MVGLNYMRNLLGFYLYKYPVRPHKRFAQLFQRSLVLVQEGFRLFSYGGSNDYSVKFQKRLIEKNSYLTIYLILAEDRVLPESPGSIQEIIRQENTLEV